MTGDVTINNTGVASVGNNVISNAKLSQMNSKTWKGNNTTSLANANDYALGNLSEATSNVLTITNGSGALLNNASIQVNQANTSTSGFLSSTDWNTFNNKQSSSLTSGNILVGNTSNVATSVAMSGDATVSNTGALTIANNAVNNSKLNTMTANTLKGNNLGTASNPSDLTVAQVNALLASNNKVYYVSASGSDTYNGLSENTAFQTLSAAVAAAGNSGNQIIIMPGTYAETTTITNLNVSIGSVSGDRSGIVNFSGTLTFNSASSSIRLSGLGINNLVHSGAGSLYLLNCQVMTSTTLSGSGYFDALNTDLSGPTSTATISVTGSGTKVLRMGSIVGVLTINNATANVVLSNCSQALPITLTSGFLGIGNTPVYSATNTSNAITSTGGVVSLSSTSCVTPSTTRARISIQNSTFTYWNSTFDYSNSNFTGTTVNSALVNFDEVVVRNIPVQLRFSSASVNSNFSVSDFTLYNVDTTTAAVTATLPTTPAVGSIVVITNTQNTFGTNNLTIARNGKTINGAAANYVCNSNNNVFTLRFNSVTNDWSLSVSSTLQTITSALNNKIIYVSKNGSDANNGLSFNTAVLTIAQALTLVDGTGWVIYVTGGSYTETLTISTNNLLIRSDDFNNTTISNVTFNGTGSLKLMNLSVPNLTIAASASLLATNCQFVALSCTTSGNVELTTTIVGTASLTGAGSYLFIGSTIGTSITINNATASVILQSMKYCGAIVGTAGTCIVYGSPIYAASNAITLASGFNLYLRNVNIVATSSNQTPSSVTFSAGSNYSIDDVVFDVKNSTLSGNRISSVQFFEKISINTKNYNVNTITTSAGTTTFTLITPYLTRFTGTQNHAVTFPSALTMIAGDAYYFINNSTGTIQINDSTSTAIGYLLPSSDALVTLTANTTAAGTWNISYCTIINNLTSTASSGTTLVLTNASAPVQQITGTVAQTIQLPAANTVALNYVYKIINNSTGLLTINRGDATTLGTLATQSEVNIINSNNSTVAGSWLTTTPNTFQITPVQPTFVSVATTTSAANYASLTFDGTNFVAVPTAGSNSIFISSDGINWTTNASALPSGQNWGAILFAGGVYVATASASTSIAAWSLNGRNWSASSTALPVNGNWTKLAFLNNTFVALNSAVSNATAAYSLDYGKSWLASSLPSSAQWFCLAAGVASNNSPYFVQLAYNSTSNAYSTNGITWTAGSALPVSGTWISMIYANKTWVAISQTGGNVIYTQNPTSTWTQATISGAPSLYNLSFGNGVYVAIGQNSTTVAFSKNLTTWRTATLVNSAPYTDLQFGLGVFVGICNTTTSFYGYYTDAPTLTTKSRNNQIVSANDLYNAVDTFSASAIPSSIGSMVPSANKLVQYDSNQLIGINNMYTNMTITPVSGSALFLTRASPHYQVFTGTNPATQHTLRLPDATTIVVGLEYVVINNSQSLVSVNLNDNSLLVPCPGGITLLIVCTNNLTTNGTWSVEPWDYNGSQQQSGVGFGTTVLTANSPARQTFSGTTAYNINIGQIVQMPVVSTCWLGQCWQIRNLSNRPIQVNSSGGNVITYINSNCTTQLECISVTGTTAASWSSTGIETVQGNYQKLVTSNTTGQTLTSSSFQYQQYTGTTNTTYTLPNAYSLLAGTEYFIFNNTIPASNLYITVNDGTGALITNIPPLVIGIFTVTNTSSIAGSWNYYFMSRTGEQNEVIYNSGGTQSIPNAIETIIGVYTAKVSDPLNQFNTGTSTFTAKYGGLYFVRCAGTYAASTTGFRFLELYVNGVNYGTMGAVNSPGSLIGDIYGTMIVRLVASDTVQIKTYQTSGGALNFGGNSYVDKLQIQKMSD
jgi:hypothetical protein